MSWNSGNIKVNSVALLPLKKTSDFMHYCVSLSIWQAIKAISMQSLQWIYLFMSVLAVEVWGGVMV